MNTETGALRRLSEGEKPSANEVKVPVRFDAEAEKAMQGRVPSVALARWAERKFRAAKKKRKAAAASRRRNRPPKKGRRG